MGPLFQPDFVLVFLVNHGEVIVSNYPGGL